MNSNNEPISHRIFYIMNYLYTYAFWLYKPVYFAYKSLSEKKKIEFLKKFIKPGMTICDIGANIGFYSVLFSKMVRNNGTIYAFEPDPENYLRLELVTKGISCIKKNKIAVTEHSGKIKLYHSKWLNVDHRIYNNEEERDCTVVNAVSMDDYFKDKIEKPDIIKLDIQGADYLALKGMKNVINESNRLIIISELWPYGLHQAGSTLDDYLALFDSLRIKIKIFDDVTIDTCRKNSDNKFFYTDFFGIKE